MVYISSGMTVGLNVIISQDDDHGTRDMPEGCRADSLRTVLRLERSVRYVPVASSITFLSTSTRTVSKPLFLQLE